MPLNSYNLSPNRSNETRFISLLNGRDQLYARITRMIFELTLMK